MLVRSFALWAVLGVSLSAAGAMLVPVAAAGPSGPQTGRPIVGSPPASTAQAQFADGKTLLLDGRLGHASVPRGGSASTFVLATVTGGDTPTDRGSLPSAHLALVVDRSGSMEGKKMSSALAAATGAVERMRDGDRVTVIAFDNTAAIIVPPTTVNAASRPSIEASIRRIRPGGDTCLSCALERATEALESTPAAADEVRRVLLISDGEATTGVRDVSGLRALAARAQGRGLGISTIGVDLAFDEKVMAAIAQEGSGRHWFVPDASALGEVLGQELGSLESAVASEAELVIEPAPGVILDEVFNRSFHREGTRVVVPLGAFDALQEKTVLVSARVPAEADGTVPVAKLVLRYHDVSLRGGSGECEGALALEVRDDGTAQSDLDPFVATRVERSRTAHALLDANALFERGRVEEARAALARRHSELSLSAPRAVARAAALSPAANAGAGDLNKDFGAQEQALAHATSGFGAAASAAGTAAPQESRFALKKNQASASDLAF